MGYTAPPTVSTDDAITASLWNTYIRDDISFLFGPPRCTIYSSVDLTITNNTDTYLSFDSEVTDPYAMHPGTAYNGAGDSTTIVAPVTGIYAIDATIYWAADTTGTRRLKVMVNGTSPLITDFTTASTSGSLQTRNHCFTLYPLSAGNYVQCLVAQTSGGNLDVQTTSGQTRFSAFWIGG